MSKSSSGNFFLGLLLGAAAGAAAAYFADRNKREAFSENFSSGVERARDSIVEGYYEAKNRYNRYRNKLTEETNDLLDEIADKDKANTRMRHVLSAREVSSFVYSPFFLLLLI